MGVGFRTGFTGALSHPASKVTPRTLIIAGLSLLLLAVAAIGVARANSNETPTNGANLQLDVSSSTVSPAIDETHRSKTSVTVKKQNDGSAETNAADSGGSNTTLRINDQDVPVTDNGSFHKHIKTNGGNVEVQIESTNNQSSKSSSHSSDNSSSIEIETNSTSYGGTSVQKEESID